MLSRLLDPTAFSCLDPARAPALRASQKARITIPARPGTRLKNAAYQQEALISIALAEYCFIFNIF